jgi:1-acyl-sn-glycerol-3-phosphate acyltransferase
VYRVVPHRLGSGAVEEGWLPRWGRRSLTIPAFVAGWLLSLALAPFAALALWLGAGVIARVALFAAVFLSYEMAGLTVATWLWVSGQARDEAPHLALRRWWAAGLFRAAARLFRIELEIEGESAVSAGGPVVVLIRHTSVADSLLPELVLANRHGLQLNYVLKRELLRLPSFDVVGQRLRCAFVQRGSGDGARELAAIESLARGLGPKDGVLIYPEGTRFTEEKRARALARVAEAGPPERAARVSRLRHVLPPRSGGPLALLKAAAPADALWLAHTGLEGLGTLRDVLSGGIVGRHVRVALWRTPTTGIPADRDGAVRWLDEAWERMDAWVDAALETEEPA